MSCVWITLSNFHCKTLNRDCNKCFINVISSYINKPNLNWSINVSHSLGLNELMPGRVLEWDPSPNQQSRLMLGMAKDRVFLRVGVSREATTGGSTAVEWMSSEGDLVRESVTGGWEFAGTLRCWWWTREPTVVIRRVWGDGYALSGWDGGRRLLADTSYCRRRQQRWWRRGRADHLGFHLIE